MKKGLLIGVLVFMVVWAVYRSVEPGGVDTGPVKGEVAHKPEVVSDEADEADATDATDAVDDVLEDVKHGFEPGNRPPDFTLETLQGNEAALSDFRGQYVFLNFWGTWCPPCRAEMPDMQRFYEDYAAEGVEVVAVNALHTETGENNVERFRDEYGLTFPIPLDSEGEVSRQYLIGAFPTTFILDEDGVIQEKIIGPMTYEWMVEQIRKR